MSVRGKKQDVRKIIESYSEEELEAYEELYQKYENMPPHTFSKEYREKMEELLKQPMPMQRKGRTIAYRLAMICACAAVALLIVNQASAYVFGMTLWDKLTEPAPEEMVTTIYQGRGNGKNRKGSGTEGRERVHDIPTEIPEGYELVSDRSGKESVFVKWESDHNGQMIFASSGISQDVHIYENEDWEAKEAVVLAGYQGEFYIRERYSYLYWDDEEYHNSITSTDMSKSQMLTVAESLYNK